MAGRQSRRPMNAERRVAVPSTAMWQAVCMGGRDLRPAMTDEKEGQTSPFSVSLIASTASSVVAQEHMKRTVPSMKR